MIYITIQLEAQPIQSVKMGLQALSEYSTHLNEPNNSQSTYVRKSMPAEIREMFMWSLQQVLYVVPTHFNSFVAQRCALYQKFLVSLESPERHSLLVPAITLSRWAARNSPKSLDVSTAKTQRIKVRGSCRPVDWASSSHPLFTEILVRVLCDNVQKMRWCPIIHEPHVLSLMKRRLFQEY
jgi:hypothetical protein